MPSANVFSRLDTESRIFLNRDRVTPHYCPPRLPFRERQIDQMARALGVCLRGQKPDNLFLYGKTGTGKTATTRWVLGQLNDYIRRQNRPVRTLYVNGRTYNSKYKVLSHAVSSFYEGENFVGFSNAFIYEKFASFVAGQGAVVVVAVDEIDKVKDVDELVYALTRMNDELARGSVSLVGISNQLTFKDRLDPRTKSSLCEQELLFPPYNAEELAAILSERVEEAFRPDVVDPAAVQLAAAIAAQESGDARTAVLLLLRGGEWAEEHGLARVTEHVVRCAKKRVEEELLHGMVSTLPDHQQLLLYALASLTAEARGVASLGGAREPGVLMSGQIYDAYAALARQVKGAPVTARWFRQYMAELEMYGLVLSTASGKGLRGQTRLVRLLADPHRLLSILRPRLQA